MFQPTQVTLVVLLRLMFVVVGLSLGLAFGYQCCA